MRIALAAAVAATAFMLGGAEARTWRVDPGPDAQAELQRALSSAESGDTVRLRRGRYELTQGLTLSANDITLRGEGEDRTVLSFAGQQDNAPGLFISGNEIVLREFGVEDGRGGGVVVENCDDVELNEVRAEWTRGPDAQNGAYGLHLINCSNALIENSIARGASAAGIAVSQSRNVIVRRNMAERNTAGLAIENSTRIDVLENIAQHNAAGAAVFNLPGRAQADAQSVRLLENTLSNNDTPNTAAADSSYGFIPVGTGVLVMAGRNVHVRDNEIGGNGTANVIVAAYRDSSREANYSPLPSNVMIRDNRFGASGATPAGAFAALGQTADVIWDGADTYYSANGPRTEIVRVVMDDNRAGRGIGTFLSLGLNVAGAPLSEAAPNPAYPPIIDIEEPDRVRID